jgi:uncharacterized protein (DUF362 family)
VAGAATLGGLGVAAYELGVIPSGAAIPNAIRDHRVSLPKGSPDMVVARGTSAAKNVAAALERFGSLARFVGKGDRVVIKPNVAWDRNPAQAGCTDPEVVAAIVRACRDAGVTDLVVTDCPVDDPARCFVTSGIRKAAEQAGARVILPSEAKRVEITIPGLIGSWHVLEPFVSATKLINVPVAKHHGGARVTAGMKNWIGITNEHRGLFHAGLDEAIARLAALMRPTLTIVDATRVLLHNGPRGGNLDDVRTMDTVAVSIDPVAVDRFSAELLGAKTSDVGYLRLAAQLGLGTLPTSSLNVVELTTG